MGSRDLAVVGLRARSGSLFRRPTVSLTPRVSAVSRLSGPQRRSRRRRSSAASSARGAVPVASVRRPRARPRHVGPGDGETGSTEARPPLARKRRAGGERRHRGRGGGAGARQGWQREGREERERGAEDNRLYRSFRRRLNLPRKKKREGAKEKAEEEERKTDENRESFRGGPLIAEGEVDGGN